MPMSAWTKTFSKTYSGITKEAVWRVWTDVNHWPEWHGDLESCTMEGAFQVGNHFMLKPKGMRAVKIMLVDMEEGSSFTDSTAFLGATMHDTHAMEETSEGVRITNTLALTGPLKWLWIKLVAQHIADTIEEETEALVKLARQA